MFYQCFKNDIFQYFIIKTRIPTFKTSLFIINFILLGIALHLYRLKNLSLTPKTFKSIEVNSGSCEHEFGDFPTTVALNSFPGSGNTWARQLIEHSTRAYSGSVYMDSQLYEGGFLGEYRPAFSGTTIVQKIHNKRHSSLASSYFSLTTNCIMLFRNPIEAMLAEYKRVHGKHGSFRSSHTLDVDIDIQEWKTFFQKKWLQYLEDNTAFLDQCENLHVIFFPDLQNDPVGEMKNTVDFLSQVHERNLNFYKHCVSKDSEGFKRKSNQDKNAKAYAAIANSHKASLYAGMQKDLEPRILKKTGKNIPKSFYDL